MAVITVNKNVLGGLPCFTGTRVPVSILFDHLKKGYTLDEFLDDFPSVKQSQAEEVLDLANNDVPGHAVHIGDK